MAFRSEQLTENQYLITHEVGPNQHGIRLDTFLKQFYTRRSREDLKRAIGVGSVSVVRNQSPHLTLGRLKPSSQLIPGDAVFVLRERSPEPAVCFDYSILFEDDCILVIDKPPNLPVHPAGRYFFNTLIVHLKTQGHQTPLKADQDFFLVHRIDKETSGVLVLAKTREACAKIVEQFSKRMTEKRYLALVHGVAPEEFSVNQPLCRSLHSKIKLKMEIAQTAQGGRGLAASTQFKRLEARGEYSLLECIPKTGRQHQIRVHLEWAGHPIVGDKLYGRSEEEALRFYERKFLSPEAHAKLLLPRHALHAAGIALTHPLTGKCLKFQSELPEDLRRFFMERAPSSDHRSHL